MRLPKFSIAIINCWYGPYPWYFQYFLHSCKYNPGIDFFIVTDNKETILRKPNNVTIVYKTLDQIKDTASEKLKLTAIIDNPYKLNDFKPAYGFMFNDLIEKYDYWGSGDMDVVYGSLRKFLTKKILERYDIFSFRPEYLTGSLTIYRNTKYMNELFMKSKDYEYIFSSKKYYNFDECCFLFSPLWEGTSIDKIKSKIESMTHLVNLENKNNRIRAYFDFHVIEGDIGGVKWENGRIFYKGKFEAMYYHLLKFKQNCITKYAPIAISKKHVYNFSPTRIYKRPLL